MATEGVWDVLVVDDEPVVREAVCRVLGAAGLSVATARDAASALAHPALASCRLALCDLMLPDRTGMDLLADLRRLRPDLPVVVITGYATADHAARAREAGAFDFLAKPFEAEELLTVVRQALETRVAAAGEKRS
ncbi:MAG TPA: response regulator [Candidatus Polarisedimenticolia bacterium]|nr:response regulator [Candidatus Polarisedimenticolia bacterium]